MKTETICGIDEAGRGALAGPLVAAAVVFPAVWRLEMANPGFRVRDAKLLTARQRQILFEVIQSFAVNVDLEILSVGVINRKGIGWANRIAFTRLIKRNDAARYVCDGNFKLKRLGKRGAWTKSIIGADGVVPSAMAAGIVAKIARDQIMHRLHGRYSRFNWLNNMGYGTRFHLEALSKHGSTSHHRTLFVKTALRNYELKRMIQPRGRV